MTEGLWDSGAGAGAGERMASPLFEMTEAEDDGLDEFRGVDLSADFLGDLDGAAFRRVFRLVLTHAVVDREELLETFGVLLESRSDLLRSIFDLLVAHEELWPWVKTFDPSTLCSFRRFAQKSDFEATQTVRFFVMLGSVIEARPEMAFTPDGRQFSSWLEWMLAPQEH